MQNLNNDTTATIIDETAERLICALRAIQSSPDMAIARARAIYDVASSIIDAAKFDVEQSAFTRRQQ